MPITIRDVTSAELARRRVEIVERIGYPFLKEMELTEPFDPTFFITYIGQLEAFGVGGFWLAENNDEPVGALVWILGPMLYSGQKCLDELFFYVLPEYRHTRAAILLVKKFIEKAQQEDANMRMFHMGAESPISRLFKNNKFHVSEVGYRRDK